ncbi:MAG: hypothetical protein ACOCUU_01635 [Nanoarchaeota archaeon]
MQFSFNLFYLKLKKLFNDGKKDFYFIIAPPRSGSTVLEKVISNSRDISLDLHEPFMEFGRRRGKLSVAYKNLFEQTNKTSGKILIKEMSHDILKKRVYKRLINLTDNLIILNIRDPLLCAESRIVSILKASHISLRYSTKKFILNLLQKQLPKDTFKLYQKKFLNRDSIKLNKMLLKLYAQYKGYKNWQEYIREYIKEKEYREFEDFLMSDNERFMGGFGWKEMSIIYDYLKKKDKRFLILDNTMFRSCPKIYTKKICEKLKLNFSLKMLNWNKGAYNYVGHIWYSSVNNSSYVKPPLEQLPEIDKFPLSVQRYLQKVAIPIYNSLKVKEFRL